MKPRQHIAAAGVLVEELRQNRTAAGLPGKGREGKVFMRKILIVVDMQNDFISGPLGSSEAEKIVSAVAGKMRGYDEIIFTKDTHDSDYLGTREGKSLLVEHCIEGSEGWQIADGISIPEGARVICKNAFGSMELAGLLKSEDEKKRIDSVCLVGVCTDICVISNAIIARSVLPEATVSVDASCCAGVTPESHETALKAMQACHIIVER